MYFYENYRRQSNRFINVNGGTYFVDAYGHLIAGALYPVGEYIYYFDATGLMQTGLINLGDGLRYFDENGHMAIGWTNVLGNTYFFDPATGGLAVTGFISDGVLITSERTEVFRRDCLVSALPCILRMRTEDFRRDL